LGWRCAPAAKLCHVLRRMGGCSRSACRSCSAIPRSCRPSSTLARPPAGPSARDCLVMAPCPWHTCNPGSHARTVTGCTLWKCCVARWAQRSAASCRRRAQAGARARGAGRVLNVAVCPADTNEPPRVLNYLTAPHVYVWSAVSCSSAFPLLFEPQELYARDHRGNRVKCAPAPAPGRRACRGEPGGCCHGWRACLLRLCTRGCSSQKGSWSTVC